MRHTHRWQLCRAAGALRSMLLLPTFPPGRRRRRAKAEGRHNYFSRPHFPGCRGTAPRLLVAWKPHFFRERHFARARSARWSARLGKHSRRPIATANLRRTRPRRKQAGQDEISFPDLLLQNATLPATDPEMLARYVRSARAALCGESRLPPNPPAPAFRVVSASSLVPGRHLPEPSGEERAQIFLRR